MIPLQETPKRNTASLLQLILSSLAVLLSTGLSILLLAVVVVRLLWLKESFVVNADAITLSFIIFAFGIVFLPSAFSAWQHLRGSDQFLFEIKDWKPGVFIGLGWVISLAAGRYLPIESLTRTFVFPVAHFFAVLLPILFILWFSLRGFGILSRSRVSGLFNLSLVAAPAISIMLEGVILVGVIGLGVVYLMMNPDLATFFQDLADQVIALEMSTEQLQAFLGVYLQSPLTVLVMLVFFSISTPLIEEAVKPLALLILRRQITARDGFIYGLVCGAAFAFFETILSALQSDPADWLVVVVTRAGTGLLHMFATALVGMGFGIAVEKKNFFAWLRYYLIAVIIHGVWNSIAILYGISGFSQATRDSFLGRYRSGFAVADASDQSCNFLEFSRHTTPICDSSRNPVEVDR